MIFGLLRSKKPNEIIVINKSELTVYTNFCTIPTSHVVLYDQESVALACSIFRDLCRLAYFFLSYFFFRSAHYSQGSLKNRLMKIQRITIVLVRGFGRLREILFELRTYYFFFPRILKDFGDTFQDTSSNLLALSYSATRNIS